MLALARIAGETAPLLFTSFNNRFFTTSLTQPIASLTVQVFTYAISPYEDWHRQAWAGALVLVTIVLLCSLLARVATRRLERMHARTLNARGIRVGTKDSGLTDPCVSVRKSPVLVAITSWKLIRVVREQRVDAERVEEVRHLVADARVARSSRRRGTSTT